uniref:Negative elongation factor E n=1 Tax=Ciona intestinalis TaxID=7719 RepID=F6RSR2_CIOIN|nr:negative elongation factor E-like [Ciona intestinalis]|eukprot:XP_002128038.1 negative elongation factor E-like [Ciona intestinalis]
MVFSSKLTEEEQMLKRQYEVLRNLKKELKVLTLKRKQAQEESSGNTASSNKQNKTILPGTKGPGTKPQDFLATKQKLAVKPIKSFNAAANTEAAKQLLKSGAIHVKAEKKTAFKRSSNLKRKLTTETDQTKRSTFQSFSTGSDSTGTDNEEIAESKISKLDTDNAQPISEHYKPKKEQRTRAPRREKKTEKKAPRKGNTLYVHGYVVSEKMIEQYFSKFGNIIKVNMEREKNSAFVSYDTFEAAEHAISELDDSLVDDCRVKVSLARHQPLLASVTQETPWGGLAERGDKGASIPDSRTLVTYGDDLF